MPHHILLESIALMLAIIHFGAPLTYYLYMKKKWLNKPWNLRIDPNYTPRVAVIVPTYNEAKLVQWKLDNIYMQDYPRDRLEVIVVDSASTDNTPRLVREWAEKHPDLKLKLVEEQVRKGKAHALNHALRHVPEDTEVVIITDVDSYWPNPNTLRTAVGYLSDPSIGAVSCLKQPVGKSPAKIEEGYRDYYNIVRLAESKAYSTPVFHGELAAYKRRILKEIGGFPEDIGADDSHTATLIALKGYRAITPEDLWCTELVPRKGYTSWRIRRAQHLTQHFQKTLKIKHKTPKQLKRILAAEAYLHLANPWLLIAALTLLLAAAAMGSQLALTLLALGTALLAYKPYRTWITTQLYLIIAMIRNLYTKETIWEKQVKH